MTDKSADKSADKRVLIPGPDHPITITPQGGRVVVSVAGRVIADTRRALTLAEASYRPVQYIPREDVDMSQLTRTQHTSHCPTRAMRRTTAFPLAAPAPTTRCGPMNHPIKRSPRSPAIWPSTRIASIALK